MGKAPQRDRNKAAECPGLRKTASRAAETRRAIRNRKIIRFGVRCLRAGTTAGALPRPGLDGTNLTGTTTGGPKNVRIFRAPEDAVMTGALRGPGRCLLIKLLRILYSRRSNMPRPRAADHGLVEDAWSAWVLVRGSPTAGKTMLMAVGLGRQRNNPESERGRVGGWGKSPESSSVRRHLGISAKR
jgi:hypothetical protein